MGIYNWRRFDVGFLALGILFSVAERMVVPVPEIYALEMKSSAYAEDFFIVYDYEVERFCRLGFYGESYW